MSDTPTTKQTSMQKPATGKNTASETEQDTTSSAEQLSKTEQNPGLKTEQNSPSDTQPNQASVSEQSSASGTEIVIDRSSVADGKTVQTPNALVHGLYAKDIILPGESEEEFERMWREFREEWSPEGRSEQETLLSIANLTWKKHRLMRTTQLCFNKNPVLSELQKKGYKTWTEVWDFIQDKSGEQAALREEVKAALHWLTSAGATPEIEELRRSIKLLNAYLAVQRKTGDNPSRLIEQAYDPDNLEKLVRIEASIDARIDKLLGRLVHLKSHKQMISSQRSLAPKSE